MDIDNLIQIKSNDLKPAKGRVLISEPFLTDVIFGRSVILILEHDDEDGTFGVVMNKPVLISPGKFLNVDVPQDEDVKVYIGGPVSPEKVFFIHPFGDMVPDSIEIIDGLYWGGDGEVVDSLLSSGKIKLNQMRFFFGYSGWEKGQLKSELERNSWLVSDTSVGSLMRTDPQKMWRHYVKRMGTKYNLWLRFPENPSIN